MYSFQSVKYPDVFSESDATAETCLIHGKKVYAIGSEKFTGELKSIKFLAKEKAMPLFRVEMDNEMKGFDQYGRVIPSDTFKLKPVK